jgi:hypothetical protein
MAEAYSNDLTSCVLMEEGHTALSCHEEPDKPAFPTVSRPSFCIIVEPRATVDAKVGAEVQRGVEGDD